jgi:hypothetical protein
MSSGEGEWKAMLNRGEPLPRKLALNTDLLEEIGVDSDDIKAVLESLIKNRLKTMGLLLLLQDENEAKQAAGDDLSGKLLWEFVQEQKKARDAVRTAASVRAGAALSNQLVAATKGVSKFILDQLLAEIVSAVPEDGPIRKKLKVDHDERFIELVGQMNGAQDGRDKLYVRDCMPDMIEKIMSYLETKESADRWLILGGSRGCGKSIVGSLVVILLAAKGHLVMYQHRGQIMIVFSEKVHPEARIRLDELMQRRGISALAPGTGVWALHGDIAVHGALYSDFKMEELFIFVQDLGDADEAKIPPRDGNGRRLIVSSPNASKLHHLERTSQYTLLIMPTWKLEEIRKLEAKAPEAVEERFRRVKGIPRWVTDQPMNITENTQDRQIENLPLDVLVSVIRCKSYLSLPAQVQKAKNDASSTDLIFRIEPKSGTNGTDCVVRLTSNYVYQKLAQRYVESTSQELSALVAAVQGVPELSEMRGKIFEAAVHRAFTEGDSVMSDKMSISKLGTTTLTRVVEDVATMKFAPQAVEFLNVSELPSVATGTYYKPIRKNEKTIDSFTVVDEDFVKRYFPGDPALKEYRARDPKTRKQFIIFFQITVSAKHVVNGTVLKSTRDAVSGLLGLSKLPMIFVFVTTAGGISERQTVTRDGPNVTKRIAFENQEMFGNQYALHLKGKFSDIARMCTVDAVLSDVDED